METSTTMPCGNSTSSRSKRNSRERAGCELGMARAPRSPAALRSSRRRASRGPRLADQRLFAKGVRFAVLR